MVTKIKKLKNKKMRKIVKIILKSEHIKKRFLEKVKSKIKMIQKNKQKQLEEDELDDHNDSSNWSYA
jgi:hypothetical protein